MLSRICALALAATVTLSPPPAAADTTRAIRTLMADITGAPVRQIRPVSPVLTQRARILTPSDRLILTMRGSWTPVAYRSHPASRTLRPAGFAPGVHTIVFTPGGRYAYDDGCNHVRGSMGHHGGLIAPEPGASTRRYCSWADAGLFQPLLMASRRVQINGDRMVFLDARSRATLEFRRD